MREIVCPDILISMWNIVFKREYTEIRLQGRKQPSIFWCSISFQKLKIATSCTCRRVSISNTYEKLSQRMATTYRLQLRSSVLWEICPWWISRSKRWKGGCLVYRPTNAGCPWIWWLPKKTNERRQSRNRSRLRSLAVRSPNTNWSFFIPILATQAFHISWTSIVLFL